MRAVTSYLAVCLLTFAASAAFAQGKPMSPTGTAATQVGGEWSSGERPRFTGGKWIEITYGRPILRGRNGIFGSGETYGQQLNAGAPVWRAGANMSTRLNTEVALKIGDATVPAGEYSLFVELKEGAWTLIVSNHRAQETYDPNEKDAIWGAYGYKPELDVARAPMTVQELEISLDQLTVLFSGMTQQGGSLSIAWDNQIGSVVFSLAE
jgi:hypothetical protein